MNSSPKSASEGGIRRVIELASPISERLNAGGYSAYVVGGLVRDLYVGRGFSVDIDMTTNALPGEIKELVAPIADDVWLQGERFGTIGCRIDGIDFEITTHRAEHYDKRSRKPQVEFASAIESDLSRRDFTVNAMAISVPDGELVDPFGGAEDLAALRLRTPADPAASFSDDPLRILRAARFQAGYDLVPIDEMVGAATDLVDRLAIVSKERIRVELDKLLATTNPASGLRFLTKVGAWPWILPEVHGESGLPRFSAVADARCPKPESQLLARRALLFGVCETADVSLRRLKELRYSNLEQRRTTAVIKATGMAVASGAEPAANVSAIVRRILGLAHGDWPAAMLGANVLSAGSGQSLDAERQRLETVEDLSDLGAGLNSAEVMNILGVEPGRIVGEAIAELTRVRIEEGQLTKDELNERLTEWLNERTDGR